MVVFYLIAAALAGCARSSSSALPVYANKCSHVKAGLYSVAWCHEYLPSSSSQDVVYYFHGIGGSENSWSQTGLRQALRSGYWKSQPHVISVSFGPRWFLSDVAVIRRSRMDVFVHDVMPLIEKDLGFKPQKQIAMGESMGGYNAIQLAHQEPQAFDRLVALCPAIMAYSPYWSGEQKNAYLSAHPFMNGGMLWKLTLFGVYEFPSPAIWARNNPLHEISSGNFDLPRTLLSANAQDQYGFDDGIRQFSEILRGRDHATEFVQEAGGHCQHSAQLYQDIDAFTAL